MAKEEGVTECMANVSMTAAYVITALALYLRFHEEIDRWFLGHVDHLQVELKAMARERLVDLPTGGKLWLDVAEAVGKGAQACKQWASS